MIKDTLAVDFRKTIINTDIPLPNSGCYELRLQRLFDLGRLDLSLAKLAEAHLDAIGILNEATIKARKNTAYAVWAADIPGKPLTIEKRDNQWLLSGTKSFCSGASLVDRALVTVDGWLIDLNLKSCTNEQLKITNKPWVSLAFKDTNTATVTFNACPFDDDDIIGERGWYLKRLGFWQGALGPAACWAGGAAGLIDYAFKQSRCDAHTNAHLGAMCANQWAMQSLLNAAGQEINLSFKTSKQYQLLALKVRHLIEQSSTDILRRFARAYGPFPLACDSDSSRRYQELDLFLRQHHAERDLEVLGTLIKTQG